MHEEPIHKTVRLSAQEISLLLRGLEPCLSEKTTEENATARALVDRLLRIHKEIEAEIAPFTQITQHTEDAHSADQSENMHSATEQWF